VSRQEPPLAPRFCGPFDLFAERGERDAGLSLARSRSWEPGCGAIGDRVDAQFADFAILDQSVAWPRRDRDGAGR